jgi:hypothetical protein
VNYFAHGLRFLDRPHFLAGTAVPDWLSVVDRKVRVRPKLTAPLATGDGSGPAEVAAGILQHIHDDGWFHTTQAFAQTSWKLTREFREIEHDGEEIRAGFLGHVVTEMLLDAVLIARDPELLDEYYATLARADAGLIQDVVNQASRRQTQELGIWIDIFLRERFLHDYLEPARLLHRLNQVMRRVKLQPLPEATIDVLERGREIVAARADELLPARHWSGGGME